MRKICLAVFLLAGCEEEALEHPPAPPEATLAELQAASLPSSQPSSTPAPPPAKLTTMLEFMRDQLEPEARKALLSKKPDPALDRLLRILAVSAPADPKMTASLTRSWQALTENSLKPGRYAQGCKQCHQSYLRYYKKKYGDRTFAVPEP